MDRELADGDAADVAAARELGNIFGNRIVERHASLVDGLGQQDRLEHLAQRGEVEERVGRHRPAAGKIGEAVAEEQGLAADQDRHRHAAGTVGRHQAMDLFADKPPP